jgi:pSer/pThr/pTyr-binding forkhead associated (FHA) protein
MTEGTGICPLCQEALMDDGQCLYCTTFEALTSKPPTAEGLLKAPPDGETITLVESENGTRFAVKSARVRIGRDPSNQIIIRDDVYVSRHHAFITFEEGHWWIEDLGSRNGTLLNDAHILQREMLTPGDKLTIGHTLFCVEQW